MAYRRPWVRWRSHPKQVRALTRSTKQDLEETQRTSSRPVPATGVSLALDPAVNSV